MGTRSLIHFKNDAGATLVTVYRQFDGYPSGRGEELARWLEGKHIVNGIPAGEDTANLANGMGCLAAQWIAHEKTDVGGVYIYPPDASGVWEDYVYIVSPTPTGGLLLTAAVPDDEPFYSGSPHEFDGDKLEAIAVYGVAL